ncbi:hypothetical protein ACYKDZ_17825 [Stutzerimonas stutzeri]
MTKHTPGPWLVEGRTVYALNDDGYNRFSALVQDAHTPGDELEANARLIAAAPDLLEAAELALEVAEGWIHDQLDGTGIAGEALGKLDSVRAAIAKARGEA